MSSESEKKTKSYFPFETCEKPREDCWIAQPYSTAVNCLNSLIIIFFLIQTKNSYTFFFLFSIFIFELLHTFSHAFHIDGAIQTNIIHGLAYCINAALLYVLYRHSGIAPSLFLSILIMIFVGIDIYALFFLSTVFYILTQFLIFLSILFFYFTTLPTQTKSSVKWLVFLGILIVCLVYNEIRNCDEMAKLYPDAPFHILVEIPGVFFFYLVCRNFYEL
jgi:hypothetical protein